MGDETSEKMVRTTITLPASMKREMDERGLNWSAVLRAAIRRELDNERRKNVVEAVLLNERLRRKAPEGWDSAEEIRRWRDRRL
jgi:post-segregation antitoxin (ccd killing protein)